MFDLTEVFRFLYKFCYFETYLQISANSNFEFLKIRAKQFLILDLVRKMNSNLKTF